MGKLKKPPEDSRLLEFIDNLEEEDFTDEEKVKEYVINPLEDIVIYLNRGSTDEAIASIKTEISLSQILAFKACSVKEQIKLIFAYLIANNKEGLINSLKTFICEAEEAFLTNTSLLSEIERKRDPGSTCLLVAEEKVKEAQKELSLVISENLHPGEIFEKASSIRKLVLDSYELGALSVLFNASLILVTSREDIDKYEVHRKNAADLRSSEEAFLNKLLQDAGTINGNT